MARYRALFISDVHLGTRNCQAELLCEFLDNYDAETLYLVGDIIDFWRIKRGAFWTEAQRAAIDRLFMKERSGTRIVYIPGNHDDNLRVYCGMSFGNIEIRQNAIFETIKGRRYVVMHGDEIDVVVNHARWLALLGDRGYQLAMLANIPINFVRRRFGFGYWSLSAYLKGRVKEAVNFIGDFESLLSDRAKLRDAHGIICGHIHRAASKPIGDIHYVNTGDWIESCTAVVENDQGELELINWLDISKKRASGNTRKDGIGVAA
ncbi:MAG: UDP-2,3-diacylglucosamine diphosphatase [Hyphomicrobiaceae bacterium]|nr:UDP-2,3-diacylglucosamine diphosphatase [Hyphomicrobiaceae bacterium]